MALLGPNIDDATYEGLRRESIFSGATTKGIGRPGEAKVLRFDVNVVKTHIEKWVNERPRWKFIGIDELKIGIKSGLLRQGQLIFQEVPLSHHEDKEGYVGWIYNLFCPFITVFKTKQSRKFAYFHVAVYVGENYVVENGGFETKDGYGSIALRNFDDAFADEKYGKSFYFVVSPPRDKEGKSTRYLVCQKALASIGVRFRYHSKSVNCETFATAMLGNIDDVDFKPIQSEILRSHKKDLVTQKQNENMEHNLRRFKSFHKDLRRQINKVPVGIVLSLDYYLNRPNKNEHPWFMQMIDSYQYFFDAAKNGNEKKCIDLLSMGLMTSSRTKNGYSALMHAVQAGNLSLCCELIEFGAEINSKNSYGNTALIKVAQLGNLELCTKLIDFNANIDHQNENGKNALMIAAGKGNVKVCCELIARGGNPNLTDNYKNTALMYSAETGYVETCKELMKGGANINAQNEDGETALMIAAREGHIFVSKEMCKHNISIDIQDKYKNTALMHASYEGYSELCAVLINSGADPNIADKQGSTALMHVAHEGILSVSTELIKGDAVVDKKNDVGRTALMYAAQEGHALVCRELIKGGADVNQTNAYGRSILMYAAREGNASVCDEVLRHGTGIDLYDAEGYTAFMIAAQSGHGNVCEMLYKKGANVNMKNKQGTTGLMLAHESIKEQVKGYVVSHYAAQC